MYPSPELCTYILGYYGHLMRQDEALAARTHLLLSRAARNPEMRQAMIARGAISTDPAVLKLLENGLEAFQLRAVTRILTLHRAKIFLNYCPRCGRLARTPYARQCRCGHSWRDTKVT